MHISVLYSLISKYGEEKKVILDEEVDELLPVIHEFIKNNGLDPAQLGNYSESIFPHLVSSYSIDIVNFFSLEIILFSNFDKN